MIAPADASILKACKTLFGPDTCVSPTFLRSLNANTIKIAFRRRARETHPDLFSAHDIMVQRRQSEMFRVVNEAYEIIRRYCESRDAPRVPPPPPSPPRRAADPSPVRSRIFREEEYGWLYRGIMPERRLEIGRYIYYRGRVPYHILLRALAWQMRQRPVLGVIAKQWGWLNDEQVRSILRLRCQTSRFGQRALQLGLLSSYQARILISYQRTLQKKLGQYFVDHGHLSRTEMEQMAADLARHNARFPVAAITDWRPS